MTSNGCVSIFSLILFLSLLIGCVVRCKPWSNVWAVKVDGGDEVARMVARKYNHEYLGKVSSE